MIGLRARIQVFRIQGLVAASAGFQIPSYYQAGNARKACDSQRHGPARDGPGVTGRASQQ